MSVPAWLTATTYAHRGLHGPGTIENSPAAFAAAIARNLGIECDVRLSADGEAMVFHDATLDRLTQQTGPVAARTANELTQIALGTSGTIPTFADLLTTTAGRVPLLVEIKNSTAQSPVPIAQAVARALHAYAGPVAVMSFDARVVRWFARHRPATLRGLVITESEDRIGRGDWRRRLALAWCRPHFLAYDVRDLPSRFAAAQRQRGLPALTWTVRDAAGRATAAEHADAAIAEAEGLA